MKVTNPAKAPGPWITISTFQGDWLALSGYHTPSYRLIDGGNVELKGAITSASTNGADLFTLPVGVRPTGGFALSTGSMQDPVSPGTVRACAIFFGTNGTVQQIGLVSASNMRVFLDGVIFSIT